MLQWCGRSYAMADGHPDGVNYATSLAPPHSEDGVAIIIEELLQLPA
jgi:hydroxymethylpyrimidine pyrophosphatase-like HAD family hydrolase